MPTLGQMYRPSPGLDAQYSTPIGPSPQGPPLPSVIDPRTPIRDPLADKLYTRGGPPWKPPQTPWGKVLLVALGIIAVLSVRNSRTFPTLERLGSFWKRRRRR